MFCPNCGAQLPDGSAFCGNCGANLNAAPETTYAPHNTYAPATGVPTKPEKKSVYLKTLAPASVKKNATLVLITALVSIALMVAGIVSAVTVPFFEIPFIATAAAAADEDVDELMDELEEGYEGMEEDYEMYEDAYSKSEREAMEKVLEVMEPFCENPSIMNVRKVAQVGAEVAEDMPEGSEDDVEEFEEISAIMDVVLVAIIAFYFLPFLFTLLGGLNKSTGLTITGIVFTVISQATMGGMILVVLNLAVGIFQAVLCSKITKEYKQYKNQCIYGY